ncbi:MAG: TSUP family transporter, partial [Oscillospiraceae bacterium]
NLLYFLPTAGMGLLSHGKSGLLEKAVLRSAIPAGLLAAALAAWLSFSVDTELLRRPFGVYLLAAGICILLQKPTKP